MPRAGDLPPRAPPAAAAPGDPAYLPLGVYWAGEHLHATNGVIDWPRVEQALDDLAAHHVTAVWLTHRSAAETAEFARRAAPRGIYVVAAIAHLAGEVPHIRRGPHAALIAGTLAAWGNAPGPVAWGLGDEPRAAYMGEMAAYVKAWREHAPGRPITTVVMHGDIEAAGQAGFDALCADIYPFFSAGNPNGYGTAPWLAWVHNLRKLRENARTAWMMGQGYQEPWGPYELDAGGDIVYLPGGGPHWAMPTPAQVRWQALAALAGGAKGMFYFIYRWPTAASPGAEPAAKLPAAVRERTDSGAPRALVYPDGRPTPQYEAMGEAFGWIRRRAAVLAPLQPVAMPEAWADGVADGSVVSLLAHPETGARYLMVVRAAEADGPGVVRITLGPHIAGLRDATAGLRHPVLAAPPFRGAAVTLDPGRAALLACDVDAANLPAAYADDFTTDRFQEDAVKTQHVRRHGSGVLSAAGHETHEQAYVVYDVDRLLPPLPAGGFRMLVYESVSVPPDFRGAFWSASDDGETFDVLSYNEPGRPVLFNRRYLKVGLSWRQSSAAYAYGCLQRFSVIQWGRAAAEARR